MEKGKEWPAAAGRARTAGDAPAAANAASFHVADPKRAVALTQAGAQAARADANAISIDLQRLGAQRREILSVHGGHAASQEEALRRLTVLLEIEMAKLLAIVESMRR